MLIALAGAQFNSEFADVAVTIYSFPKMEDCHRGCDDLDFDKLFGTHQRLRLAGKLFISMDPVSLLEEFALVGWGLGERQRRGREAPRKGNTSAMTPVTQSSHALQRHYLR